MSHQPLELNIDAATVSLVAEGYDARFASICIMQILLADEATEKHMTMITKLFPEYSAGQIDWAFKQADNALKTQAFVELFNQTSAWYFGDNSQPMPSEAVVMLCARHGINRIAKGMNWCLTESEENYKALVNACYSEKQVLDVIEDMCECMPKVLRMSDYDVMAKAMSELIPF